MIKVLFGILIQKKNIMKRNKCVHNHFSRYYPYYIISILFFWIWYLCFPFLPGPDPYGSPTNQWGIGVYLLMQTIYIPLEFIMQSKVGEILSSFSYSLMDSQLIIHGTRTFVYHLGACIVTLIHTSLLFYCLVLMTNPTKTKEGTFISLFVCIVLFILTSGFLFFVKNTDLLFCSTTLLLITFVTKKQLKGDIIGNRELFLLLIITMISVSYRKNSVIILPILICMYLRLYKSGHRLKTAKCILVSFVISIILAIPFSTSLLTSILQIEDSHGEEVFMSSDYACMRILKGETIDLDNLSGIKQDNMYLFMQNYERFGTCNDMKQKWISEIKESPKVFIIVKCINYIQFLTLGCIPNNISSILKKHYPHVYFPDAKDFCTMVDFINNPRQRFEGGKHIHQLSDFGKYSYFFKRSLLNYDLYINWSYLSIIIILLYGISFICFVYNMIIKFKNHKLQATKQLAIWFGLLEISYLLSFIFFTPTPDFRYHLFSILMAYLTIGMSFCKEPKTNTKTI